MTDLSAWQKKATFFSLPFWDDTPKPPETGVLVAKRKKFIRERYRKLTKNNAKILLMEEMLHHLGWC